MVETWEGQPFGLGASSGTQGWESHRLLCGQGAGAGGGLAAETLSARAGLGIGFLGEG